MDEQARRETDEKAYEPPALEWLGTMQTLTAAGPPGPPPEGAFTPNVSISDRALKEAFAPVDPAEILAGVLALAIYQRE